MKVRCIRLINPNTNQAEEFNSWLSVGRIYHVLCMSFEPGRTCMLRLIGNDDRTSAMHDIRQFEIVSEAIPSSWVVRSLANGYVELCPASWTEQGFWERYFDGDSDALRTFAEEYQTIVDADR